MSDNKGNFKLFTITYSTWISLMITIVLVSLFIKSLVVLLCFMVPSWKVPQWWVKNVKHASLLSGKSSHCRKVYRVLLWSIWQYCDLHHEPLWHWPSKLMRFSLSITSTLVQYLQAIVYPPRVESIIVLHWNGRLQALLANIRLGQKWLTVTKHTSLVWCNLYYGDKKIYYTGPLLKCIN